MRWSVAWQRVDSCPVCSTTGPAHFATLCRTEYARCAACGLVFSARRPPDAVLETFYNGPYYQTWRTLERERIARERYFSASAYRDMSALAQMLMPQLATSASAVLDYGCGAGSFLALLRDEVDVSNVAGFEINTDAVEIARDAYGLRVFTDPDDLDTGFDAVLLCEVLEHVAEPSRFFATLAERVSRGGIVLCTARARPLVHDVGTSTIAAAAWLRDRGA